MRQIVSECWVWCIVIYIIPGTVNGNNSFSVVRNSVLSKNNFGWVIEQIQNRIIELLSVWVQIPASWKDGSFLHTSSPDWASGVRRPWGAPDLKTQTEPCEERQWPRVYFRPSKQQKSGAAKDDHVFAAEMKSATPHLGKKNSLFFSNFFTACPRRPPALSPHPMEL